MPPGFVLAAIPLVLIAIPFTQRTGVRDRIRRLERELVSLALRRAIANGILDVKHEVC